MLTLLIKVNIGLLATIKETFWWRSQIPDHQLNRFRFTDLIKQTLTEDQLPDLCSSAKVLLGGVYTHQNAETPYVDLVVPVSSQHNLRGPVWQCLNGRRITLVSMDSRAKITHNDVRELGLLHLASRHDGHAAVVSPRNARRCCFCCAERIKVCIFRVWDRDLEVVEFHVYCRLMPLFGVVIRKFAYLYE